MSGTWLHLPPDQFGFTEDPIFIVIFAALLGQPFPAAAPVVGRYFRERGTRVDPYGANLSAVSLTGKGHCAFHNELYSIVQEMMKIGGIQSEMEPINLLLGKVADPHITSYVNHVSRDANARAALHAIVPDIHAYNFPVKSRRSTTTEPTTQLRRSLRLKPTRPARRGTTTTTNASTRQIDERN